MNSERKPAAPDPPLPRVVGVPGAVFLGLGSILGSGIFVSIGVAAGVGGSSVLLAVVVAAVVALFNGLSSAELAASHPQSGGTYEYGYRYLSPRLGFVAGLMFLCAKSASAASAALGFAGYALTALGRSHEGERIIVALLLVVLLTAVAASGMQRSSKLNAVMVTVTLVGLLGFVVAGFLRTRSAGAEPFSPFFAEQSGVQGFLHATALMFVGYTGYARIATLGEEVRAPEKSIPRAIVTTLFLTMLIYVAVTAVAVALVGADGLARATRADVAPLQIAARQTSLPGVTWLVAVAAITAMAGVLLNLLLGLSRVVLAMARRRDLPALLATLDQKRGSPRRAVLFVGVAIAALCTIGDVKTTWSFSAFSVLVYYALTNLAALRLPREKRRYPRFVAALGLVSSIGLAFWVEAEFWAPGVGLILLGLAWHSLARWVRPQADGRE